MSDYRAPSVEELGSVEAVTQAGNHSGIGFNKKGWKQRSEKGKRRSKRGKKKGKDSDWWW